MASSSSQSFYSTGDLKRYSNLYQAIRKGELNVVEEICDSDICAVGARITVNFDTALHVAVGVGIANDIVEYLLNKMFRYQVALTNKDGNTALSIAAISGNIEAAQKIMKIRPDLKDVANNDGWIPLIEAARHGQKQMIKDCLLQFSEIHLDSTDKTGVLFVNFIIIAGFHKMALELVKLHRSLATTEFYGGESLLSTIARQPSEFPSGRKLDFWQSNFIELIRTYIHIKKLKSHNTVRELTKSLRKGSHIRVIQLVKILCEGIKINLDYERASSMLKGPFLVSVKLGVQEVVEQIIETFPDAVWFLDKENHNAFQLAVMYRREKIFDRLIQMSGGHKHQLLMSKDIDGNNILHLAGKLPSQDRLNRISGPALQMQRELQWFEKVKKIVPPANKEDANFEGKTPAMIFSEEHKELVKEAEKWMKDAATSCSVAAALIATVVFAAAITVPGGSKENGQPIFYKQTAFTMFAIFDAISLFTSMASILIFLGVLTARYAEEDFLQRLPSRFQWGLVTLFLSIIPMMIAAGITVYLVFCDRKSWILFLLVAAAYYLVTLVTYSQFPLLMEILFFNQGAPAFSVGKAHNVGAVTKKIKEIIAYQN